ncbi:MAG TPA: MotA/TolQ/ExbB proton channel family protein [Terriglobales bacterium]|nr:MotA/TolQ/ExbB proton channel family protein [Terriglobales bacterium]
MLGVFISDIAMPIIALTYGDLSWSGLFESLNFDSKCLVYLLGLMFVLVAVTAGQLAMRFRSGRRETLRFIPPFAAALKAMDCEQALLISSKFQRSHVAAVMRSGLECSLSVPESFSNEEAVGLSERAMLRRRQAVLSHLRLGLTTLASIAATAPFVGLFGTVLGILEAFRGYAGSRSTFVLIISTTLAGALLTTAAGLVVAVDAVFSYRYLQEKVANFDRELQNAISELITFLGFHPLPRAITLQSSDTLLNWTGATHQSRSWEIPAESPRLLIVSLTSFGLFFLFQMFNTAFHNWSYNPEDNFVPYQYTNLQTFSTQDVFSPDRKVRAYIPLVSLWLTRHKNGSTTAECNLTDPYLAAAEPPFYPEEPRSTFVMFFPADQPIEWWKVPYKGSSAYSLHQYDVLNSPGCDVAYITWRTNEELLVQCTTCTQNDRITPGLVPDGRRITVADGEGRPLRVLSQKHAASNQVAHLLHPQPDQ